MRKFILTFIAVVGFAFASTAQCDDYSTELITACGTSCVSIQVEITYIIEVDIANYNATGGTMRRKPTSRELLFIAAATCP